MNPALQFLEELQREAYTNRGLSPWSQLHTDFNNFRADVSLWPEEFRGGFRDAEAKAELLLREWGDAIPTRTRFEDPHSFFIVAAQIREIHQKARAIGLALPSFHAGTLPTGHVNSHSYSLEDGSLVIVVQSGLQHYLNLFTKLMIMASCHGRRVSEIVNSIRNDEVLLFRFRDLAHAYILHGNPQWALPYYGRLENQEVFVSPLFWAESLVLAHELAHGVLGHHGTAPSPAIEFEADKTALEIITGGDHTPENLVGVHLGCCLLFEALATQERLLAAIGLTGGTSAGSHPPPRARLRELESCLLATCPDSRLPAAFTETGEMLRSVSDVLVGSVEDEFRALRDSGGSPNPIFLEVTPAIPLGPNWPTFAYWGRRILGEVARTDGRSGDLRVYLAQLLYHHAFDVALFVAYARSPECDDHRVFCDEFLPALGLVPLMMIGSALSSMPRRLDHSDECMKGLVVIAGALSAAARRL